MGRPSRARLVIAGALAAVLLAAGVASPASGDGGRGGHGGQPEPSGCDARSDGYGDQQVSGRRLMVAAAHPAAAVAGCEVLLRGGTAADAAVVVQMVLAVVEPQSSGLGGGTVILYYDRSRREVRFFDGLAGAPEAVTDGLRTPTEAEQAELGVTSFGSETASTGRAVGVPGTVAVLDLVHDRYGRRSWPSLVDRSIELAEDGFEIAPYLHDTMSARASGLPRCSYPDLRARYCAGDEPLPIGVMVTNPELAATLRVVRDGGADAFYDVDGPVVGAIVERAAAGPYKIDNDDDTPAVIPSRLTAADLAAYRAVEREPLCGAVLGRMVCSAGPPSFGGTAVLYQLGLMERGGVADTAPGSIERAHLAIEASRLSQFDRRAYIGDPDHGPVPADGLLAGSYLDGRFSLFSPDGAVHPITPGDPVGTATTAAGLVEADETVEADTVEVDTAEVDTTSHVSIVDARGDAISMTTTINSSFGSQIEAAGMALNNVQANFTRLDSISPGQSVNQMEARKRPRTSMAPTFVLNRRHQLTLVAGAAGGSAIPDYVVQTVLGVVVDHMNPLEAMSQAHWSGQTITSNCSGVIGARSEVESGPAATELVDGLIAIGHPCARATTLRSGSTAIEVGRRSLVGAADPRRDGAAAGR